MTITGERYIRRDIIDYSYELSPEEESRLVTKLLHEREPVSDDRFVCYEIDGDDEASNLGRTIEREVFERFFEGNDAERMKLEYGEYEQQSTFFVRIDRETQRPAGALRVVGDGPHGFKTLNDVAALEDDPNYAHGVFEHYAIKNPAQCWDIATAAVRKGYGGGETSAELYRAMWVASQRHDIRHFFSVIDEKPFELMGLVGFPFEPLSGADWMSYVGSAKSLPVYGAAPIFEEAVRDQEERTDEELRPFLHDSFRILGHGDRDDMLMLR